MANTEVLGNLKGEDAVFPPFLIYDSTRKQAVRAEKAESRGQVIEKKIEFIESLAGKVSNRRSRRWINDRLLMELVPRLNAEEIRGLFAPPPWGDYAPPSPFTMTNCPEWDPFRNINMDTEAHMLKVMGNSVDKRKSHASVDKVIALRAWHRVSCRTREVLRRHFLSHILQGYEDCVREFIYGTDEDVLVLHLQDPFHRLLLHGVCEFYDLIAITETITEGSATSKATRVRKRKMGSHAIPSHITLVGFLKMAKQGVL